MPPAESAATARAAVLAERARDPDATAAAIGRACGVSRQRVQQILRSEGLPTKPPGSDADTLRRASAIVRREFVGPEGRTQANAIASLARTLQRREARQRRKPTAG